MERSGHGPLEIECTIISSSGKHMNEKFRQIIESLQPKFDALLACPPVKCTSLPKSLPVKGIYLFSEGPTHIYVGRSNNIRNRIRNHTRASGTSYTATLAFRIARDVTGITKASYTKEGSRRDLEHNVDFRKAFTDAKTRVANVDIRYVEELDATRQAILEIFVATTLDTPFNDFDNH
jgi:predicted GIY-YIG superfamily endonuclease